MDSHTRSTLYPTPMYPSKSRGITSMCFTLFYCGTCCICIRSSVQLQRLARPAIGPVISLRPGWRGSRQCPGKPLSMTPCFRCAFPFASMWRYPRWTGSHRIPSVHWHPIELNDCLHLTANLFLQIGESHSAKVSISRRGIPPVETFKNLEDCLG